MSLYSLLFGQNPFTEQIKEILELDTAWPTGRFRDIHAGKDEKTGDYKIILYTRNGGGNRNCWGNSYYNKARKRCECPGCVISNILPQHPNYLSDYNDDFDCTYAYIEFSVPHKFKDWVGFLLGLQPEDTHQTVSERFKGLIEKMERGEQDEETRRAIKVGEQILGKIDTLFKEEK